MSDGTESVKGKTFGLWTVTFDPDTGAKGRKVTCRCSCGLTREVQLRKLLSGASTHCNLPKRHGGRKNIP